MRLVIAAMVGLMALGACSSDEERLVDEYNDQRDDFLEREAALRARSDTLVANMPTTGAATYEGEAAMRLRTPAADLSLVGDAELRADFARGTLSGRADDFIGVDGGFDAQEYDGALTLSNGRISGNDARGSLRGRLTSDDHDIRASASMSGDFKGRTSPQGILMESTGGVATVDGRLATGSVVIAAERDR